MNARQEFVAGIGVAVGIVRHAQNEAAFDQGRLLEAVIVKTHAVELTKFAARIDPAIRSPGDGLGVIQVVPQIGQGKTVRLVGHGHSSRVMDARVSHKSMATPRPLVFLSLTTLSIESYFLRCS